MTTLNRHGLSAFRLFFLLLILVLAILAGCRQTGPSDTAVPSSIPSSEPLSSAPDTEGSAHPVLLSSFKLIDNGVSAVNVVRPDGSKKLDADIQAAVEVKNLLQDMLYSGTQPIGSDWTMTGEHDPQAVEILVGFTSYEEGRSELEDLGLGSYMIGAFGNKISLCAHSWAGYEAALAELGNIFLQYRQVNGEKVTLDIPRDAFKGETVFNAGLDSLGIPEGASFSSLYDAGDNCEEVIFSNASIDIFDKYLERLCSSGYTMYTSNDMASNRFATLYNQSYTLNVGYYAYSNEIRAIVEPFAPSTLIGTEEDNIFTRVTTPTLTMLGLQYTSSAGEKVNNGLSVVIRLSDGRFIVIDGGFNTDAHARDLAMTLRQQCADYSTSGSPTVAAWIITHYHGDHNGLLNGRASTLKAYRINVEKIILNYLSPFELDRSRKTYTANWAENEGGYKTTYKSAETLGADVVVAHVGQVFHLADLKMEMLFTLESLAPDAINAMNSTSLVTKFTFTDPDSGVSTVYMSTGDASGATLAVIHKMFGSYLKSDLVQIAHHGAGTFGGESAVKSAYMDMAPSTVLWPLGVVSTNYLGKSYNRALFDTSVNPNFKEHLYALELGRHTLLPLPYKTGTAVVTAP